MKWALRFIPVYYALTAGILALFIVISGGHGIPTLEEMGAGQAIGIILGVFAGVLVITTVFFVPYFHAKYATHFPLLSSDTNTLTDSSSKITVFDSGTFRWALSSGKITTTSIYQGPQRLHLYPTTMNQGSKSMILIVKT